MPYGSNPTLKSRGIAARATRKTSDESCNETGDQTVGRLADA